MSAVMISPAIMMTIAQLRLSSSAVYVVKPDLSTAWAIPVVERTSVASTVYTRNHTSALLPHCTSLSVTGCFFDVLGSYDLVCRKEHRVANW